MSAQVATQLATHPLACFYGAHAHTLAFMSRGGHLHSRGPFLSQKGLLSGLKPTSMAVSLLEGRGQCKILYVSQWTEQARHREAPATRVQQGGISSSGLNKQKQLPEQTLTCSALASCSRAV